jgi:hypothetical protein
MNTKAIERIKGYCCEVTQEQWDELVRVSDEVGVKVGSASRAWGVQNKEFTRLASGNSILGVYSDKGSEHKEIPFPDFLAKLKGEEKWEPKAGEMVEVSVEDDAAQWLTVEFIATRGNRHFCWTKDGTGVRDWTFIRPLRPTITRTEAERLLNKRIID